MGRIEIIAAGILAAGGAFILVPGGLAAPLSKASSAQTVEQAVPARPTPSVRVVYPSPYPTPAANKGAQ